MKSIAKMAILGTAGALLSACGGGGGGDGGGGAPAVSFADLSAEATMLDTEVAGLTEVDTSSLPTSGSATYNGILGFTLNDGTPRLLSDLSITTTFQPGDGSLTGNLSNFVDADEQRYSGQMTIQNGLIDRDATAMGFTAFEADVVGSITNTVSGRTLTTSTSSGDEPFIQGDFFGEVSGQPPSHIEGIITGALEDSSGQLGITSGSLVGKR